MREERIKGNEMMDALKMLAPGTPLREGLENILRAKTGALIMVSDRPEALKVVDGGFNINKEYSSTRMYELAKMDGAIVLSSDLKKILYANTQLIPDSSISTNETGTRHRTAERIAKQTGELVISISQRRNIITLYKGCNKYIVNDTGRILTRANQALQTLEKYKTVLDNAVLNLSILEYEDDVTLNDVAIAIQRTEMVMRIVIEIDKYIRELGNEGRLVSMQLEELVNHTEEDGILILRDYSNLEEEKTIETILKQIRSYNQEELLDPLLISKSLGYTNISNPQDISVYPRGHRILTKVPKLPLNVVYNLINKFESFQRILSATIEELDDVEGIGEVRAKNIKESLRKIQDQLLMENRRV